MSLKTESRQWLDALESFVERYRSRRPLPRLDELDPLADEQRRITGGALIDLFEFVEEGKADELFPALEEVSLSDRAFVLATDLPGAAASRDLVDWDSDKALVILKEEWRAFLEDASNDSDEEFDCHWEAWSVWHQNLEDTWEIPERDGGAFWVHEEGFALAHRAGRGSKHLWYWDGAQMQLEEQAIDDWVSRRKQ